MVFEEKKVSLLFCGSSKWLFVNDQFLIISILSFSVSYLIHPLNPFQHLFLLTKLCGTPFTL